MFTNSSSSTRQDNINSSLIPRKSMSNTIKTPALLFYKPTNNSSQKNKQSQETLKDGSCKSASIFNHQETSQMLELVCQNHPTVIAKFSSKLQDDEEIIYYCQRCAHLLRQQGFCITQLSIQNQRNSHNIKNSHSKATKVQKQNRSNKSGVANYPYPERQQEIKSFISSLSIAKQEISQNNNQIREILINSEQFYGEQIQEINQYFQNIIQSLELEKNKCYNHILTQRQNAERETRAMMRKLSEGDKQISSMMLDIEENLDSVYSISWQNYKLVMDTFEARIQEIHNVLDEIRERGIAEVEYRKIQFAGVPQSINSLSQIIIQNSYGSVPEPDGSLLLTENSNSSSFQQRHQQMFSNIQENTIYQKLKTDHSQDQLAQNHLMFSFDGQKMKYEQNYSDCKQNNNYPNNMDYIYEECQMPIKLRTNRSLANSNQVDKLQGIKQVEELDAIMDEELLSIPPGLKFAR